MRRIRAEVPITGGKTKIYLSAPFDLDMDQDKWEQLCRASVVGVLARLKEDGLQPALGREMDFTVVEEVPGANV